MSSFVVYGVLRHNSKAIRSRRLETAEAVIILVLKHELCVQQKLVHAQKLPWPKVGSITRDRFIDAGHRVSRYNTYDISPHSPVSTSVGCPTNRMTNRLNTH